MSRRRGSGLVLWLWLVGCAGCNGGETPAADAAVDGAMLDDVTADRGRPGDDADIAADGGDGAAGDARAIDAAGDGEPAGDAGTDAEVEDTDAESEGTDAETDGGEVCDPACPGAQRCDDGRCVEPAVCAADLDCLDGRHCAAGACIADCFEDAACPGGRSCDLESGRCPEASPCRAAADCDPGRVCAEGACADLCGPERPCPGAQRCGDDSRCAEPADCAADEDCLGDRLCVAGACDDRCREDADCPGTRRCDPLAGRCPEPAACFAAGDCDPGRVCDGGQCTAVCAADADCPGRQQCGPDGTCQEPVACVDDRDCRGARFCLDTRCTDPCREDADCPGALRCLLDGRCGEAPMGCARDADCLGDRVCAGQICVDPECAENADCRDADPAAACVDRQCAPIPMACAGDVDCPGEQCAPVGVCATPGPCLDDAGCGGLRPVCLRGRCAACASDLDCVSSEFCDDGICVFFDGCADDTACPGRRQCAAGACLPAPCVGDAFDGGGIPMLAARTYTGLVLCDGDVDRYRVALAAGEGIEVTVRHDADAGDLGVRLTAPGAPALVYAESDGAYGIEVIGLPPSPAPQTLDIEVFGRVGYSPTYSLTLDRLPADRCPPDALEGPFGNDILAHATPIGAAPVTLALCRGDIDHLAFDAAPATELTVTATGDGLLDALPFDLLDPAGAVIASARAEDRALVLRGTLPAGRHALRLQAPPALAAPVMLDLTLMTAAAPGAAAAACAAVPAVPLPRPLSLPATLPIDRFESSCARGVGAPDHVARFRLDRAATVVVLAYPDDRQTTLAIRRTCADPASEAACVLAAETGPIPLAAGEWTVIVESSGAVPQTLEVQVR